MSAESRPIAQAAALRAFPGAEVVEVDTVGEAARYGPTFRPELLVLAEPDAASVAEANQAVDPTGVARWAVVILGTSRDDAAETVPPEEWNIPLVARAIRSAMRQHDLLRENFRLQGDLRTIARRISHDLYTPLGCIFTCAQVLENTVASDAIPTSATMVRNIKECLMEITQLIDRVNFLLRASADPPAAARCEMADVVADVMGQLEPRLQKAGATVAQPELWPEVTGVAPWLQVIWSNLLINAIKHGGPGARIRIDWARGEDGYRFSVESRGTGMSPTIEAGLFRPFDQLHKFHSPGLGLSIVQRLVDLQGGRCGYERLDGETSRFHFTIPIASPGQQPREGDAHFEAAPALPPETKNGFSGAASPPGIRVKSARLQDHRLAAQVDQSGG
jgi:signal transduction histidine kinase